MSKFVKIAIGVVAAVALVVFAPAIAGALAPLLGSISASLTAATITSSIVGMGISLGLASVAMLFRKMPSNSQSLVDRLNTQVNPTAPRKIVFGRTTAGADIRFQEKHDLAGTKKDGWSEVVALASHRIHDVLSWTVEDKLTWSKAGGITGDYKKGVLAFDTVLEGNSGNGRAVGSGAFWTADAHFTGCAYATIRFKLDPDVWQGSLPTRRTMVVEGCPVYDPRLDSSRGGSGNHRTNDQNTWAWLAGSTEIGRNPALALLTYLIGWRIYNAARNEWVLAWGMGVPLERIDLANFRTYANLCEERVSLAGGGTVQRYTFDGVFSTADTHETVHNALTASMGSCKLVDVGGMYQLIGGYDDTMGPKLELTADDIDNYQWDPAPSQRETFNIARGRYVNPEALYQLEDWPEIRLNPLADGYDRVMSLDLGGVTRAETAQRIAKQFLAREALTPGYLSALVGPRGFGVEVGGLVWISLPQQGWNRKLFRVVEQSESFHLVFQMKFREESSAVYAWDREEKEMPANIRPPGWDPRETLSPENLQVSSTAIKGGQESLMSFISIAWTPELSGRVQSIQIQTKAQGQTEWSNAVDRFDPAVGIYETGAPVPGVRVEVRARFRMTTGVYGPWVNATAVDAVNSSFVDGTARDAAQDAQDKANEAAGKANDAQSALLQQNIRWSDAIDDIEDIRGILTSTQDALSRTEDLLLLDTQTKIDQVWQGIDDTGAHVTNLQTLLVQRDNDIVAAFNDKVTVLTNAQGSQVTATEQLVSSAKTELGQQITAAIDSQKSTTALAIGELKAEIRDTISLGLNGVPGVTLEEKLAATGNAVTGYNAGWSVRVNNAGHIAGIALNSNPSGVSSLGIVADVFEIVDPSDTSQKNAPFRYADGVLTLKEAHIGKLSLGPDKLSPFAIGRSAKWSWQGNVSSGVPTENDGLDMSTITLASEWANLAPNGSVAYVAFNNVPSGSRVKLTFSLCGRQTGGNDDPYVFRIIRSDGHVLAFTPYMCLTSSSAMSQSWPFIDDDLGDGTTLDRHDYTYTVQAKRLKSSQNGRILSAGLIGELMQK